MATLDPLSSPLSGFHTAAAVISSGDELVLGQSLDTNSRAISALLVDAGVPVVEHITIGDDRGGLAAAIGRLAASGVGLVVITGGLGPTLDDLTREALADVLGESLEEDPDLLADLTAKLATRGRTVSEANRRQALRPPSARPLANALGTAPGLHARVGDCDVVCLPGPPREWMAMWPIHVEPLLRADPAVAPRRALINVVGIAESDAGMRLGELMSRTPKPGVPMVGITASGGLLTVRIRSSGVLENPSYDAALEAMRERVRGLFGVHVYSEGTESLAAAILRRLIERRESLAVCESCTAGGLGRLITSAPGSSAVFLGGFITYANALKHRWAGVSNADLDAHGAVSEPVARQMAEGAARAAGARHALSITGIAPPAPAAPEQASNKPVGLVYVAHHDAGAGERGAPLTVVRRLIIGGDREDVRDRAAVAALALLYFRLVDPRVVPALSWEVPA